MLAVVFGIEYAKFSSAFPFIEGIKLTVSGFSCEVPLESEPFEHPAK